MWDLPTPGLEPVSPALAGGFFTTAPPGKFPRVVFYMFVCQEHSLGDVQPFLSSSFFSTSPLHPQRTHSRSWSRCPSGVTHMQCTQAVLYVHQPGSIFPQGTQLSHTGCPASHAVRRKHRPEVWSVECGWIWCCHLQTWTLKCPAQSPTLPIGPPNVSWTLTLRATDGSIIFVRSKDSGASVKFSPK